MSELSRLDNVPGSVDDGFPGASYPPYPEDEILPSIPSDPVPNPEPEQPSLGVPDPGIYEGTGGTASLASA
ncbi:hypothetical protein [Terriglobus sp.]|uniref:hypothetical protein n=1 Tax=Terriglobus sp. TaxID=1889013 RepID=UPI003AFFCD35